MQASFSFFYEPTHDVAPSAVTMAVATDAMICTMNLLYPFYAHTWKIFLPRAEDIFLCIWGVVWTQNSELSFKITPPLTMSSEN